MSNPPPWNDPIKPPNGNFSLEERKWREGITRGLNNIKIKSLGDIGDVDLTSPSANEILKFDGSNWVNGTPSVTVTNWGDIVGSLSNQTDLQNALNAKVDALSLALVATSGDYDDLIDKPFYNGAELNKNNPNFYGTSSSAATDVTKIVSIPSITKLETGQVIIIKPDNTSTVANTKIQLNSFAAYPMRYNGSAITTSTDSIVWNANYPTLWLFDGTYWVFLAHGVDSNTTYTLNYSIDAGQYVAGSGSYAITRYSLILQKPNQTWEKVTATSSTYSTGTSKTANTNGFLLGQIRYYSSTTTLANGAKAATNVVYNKSSSIDLRYSTNCGGTPAWTAGQYIYLVGSIGVDGLFYLDTTKWWDNALPTTNDGKLYIRLGIVITDSSYSISLLEDRPIYYHDGVSLRQYGKADNKQDLITANNKLDYSLIANTPSIPTVNDATLTIQKNSSNVGTFTANASSNVTVDISVPTDTNDLTNGAGYITGVSSLDDIGDVTITSPQDAQLLKYDGVNQVWYNGSASSGTVAWTDITGKPSFATVATSGDYGDLINTPTIPTVNDATLTIQKNGTTVDTFTANSSTNTTVNITVPTDTGDLTNGAGFLDSSIYSTANTWTATNTVHDLIPETDITYDLGSSSKYWKKAYVSNIQMSTSGVAFEVESQHSLKIEWRDDPNASTRMIYCENSDFRPYGDKVISLGNDSNRWSNVYSPYFSFNSNAKLSIGSNNISIQFATKDSSSNTRSIVFNPDTPGFFAEQDNIINLGSSGYKWKDFYMNGDAHIGTFTISGTNNLGTTKGALYLVQSRRLFFIGGVTDNTGGSFSPGVSANSGLSLGESNYKWTVVYSTGGVNTSDRDKKDNIIPLENSLELINKLSVYSFTWKENLNFIGYGMIAQEVRDIAPELVEVPDDYEEGKGTLGMYTNNVLFLAVKAIQELSEKVTKLEQQLGELV